MTTIGRLGTAGHSTTGRRNRLRLVGATQRFAMHRRLEFDAMIKMRIQSSNSFTN